MNYLQLVNSVMRRLRENEVTTVDQNSYSKLVGEFVNDAKRIVEDAWDWSSLRDTVTVNTVADTFSYALSGATYQSKTLDVINDTSDVFMKQVPSTWMNNAYLVEVPPSTSPFYYSWNGTDASGNLIVDLYPKPDKVYSLRFNLVLRTDAFTNDTDTLSVPSAPVVQYATALAARERGETGGTSASELFALADSTLADSIALDAARFPSETVWTAC